jgi:predicted RNase H-like nuclease (RuvC/YqgF family)
MTPSEYQELTGFFIEQVGRIRDETRTVVEVTVESLRHEIRLVADGVLQNGRRIDVLTGRVEENGRRIEENGRRIEENGRRIEENGRRIEENGRRIEALTERVDTLTVRVDGIAGRMDDLERGVSGR